MDTVSLDGAGREFLVNPKNSLKTVTWGPFEDTVKVELTFYHKKDDSWTLSTIKEDKMKEVSSSLAGLGRY